MIKGDLRVDPGADLNVLKKSVSYRHTDLLNKWFTEELRSKKNKNLPLERGLGRHVRRVIEVDLRVDPGEELNVF